MTQKRLSATAQQILSLLLELPTGTGYPLRRLGEHVGTGSPEELKDSFDELESLGYIKTIKTEDFPERVAFLVSSMSNRDIDQAPQDDDSIISDFNVEFFKGSSLTTKVTASTDEYKTNRAIVSAKVDSDSEEAAKTAAPKEQPSAPSKALETVTIKQILDALSSSIENSDAIAAQDKWPLVEKINALTTHPLLRATLATPLKNIIK